jgi:hypothetical protein
MLIALMMPAIYYSSNAKNVHSNMKVVAARPASTLFTCPLRSKKSYDLGWIRDEMCSISPGPGYLN